MAGSALMFDSNRRSVVDADCSEKRVMHVLDEPDHSDHDESRSRIGNENGIAHDVPVPFML
jgi:hypothetical protein